MKTKGIITSWNDDKGFGFITSKKHEKIFVHIKSFQHIKNRPKLNQKVLFLLEKDEKGRFNASNVKIKKLNFSIILAFTFFTLLSLSVFIFSLPTWLLSFYSIASLTTFLVYWWDKHKAKNGKWRTPENTLHILSLIGGWPGALIAQQSLRHKSTKKSFRIVFWLTSIINFTVLFLVFTPLGKQLLTNMQNS